MQSYEFLPTVQRLSCIADMLETTDIQGALDMIQHAEAMAPLFQGSTPARGSEPFTTLRRFLGESLKFQAVAMECRGKINEADEAARSSRLALAASSSAAAAPGG